MLKGTLRFTVVVEPELVHGCVADGPSMADVPLLKALIGDGAEPGYIGTGRLKLREWRNQMIIVKIVIKAEVLLIIKSMVDSHGELIATLWLNRRTNQLVAAIGWGWDVVQQVNRGGIKASKRNNIISIVDDICKNAGARALPGDRIVSCPVG